MDIPNNVLNPELYRKAKKEADIKYKRAGLYRSAWLSKNPSVEEKIKMGEIIGQKYKPTRMELYERKS